MMLKRAVRHPMIPVDHEKGFPYCMIKFTRVKNDLRVDYHLLLQLHNK